MTLYTNDIVKGRIAETLVNELLKSSGNKVYRFGYETVLQNLTQLEQTFQRYTKTSEIIRSIPDLVVVNKRGEPFFVEVKFRTAIPSRLWFRKAEWDVLKKVLFYWNAVCILVTTKTPYFLIFDSTTFRKNSNTFIALEGDKKFDITQDTLKKFQLLVQDYYTC